MLSCQSVSGNMNKILTVSVSISISLSISASVSFCVTAGINRQQKLLA